MTSVSNAAVGAYLAGNAAAKARHGMNEAIARLSTGVRAMYGGDAGGASAAIAIRADGKSAMIAARNIEDGISFLQAGESSIRIKSETQTVNSAVVHALRLHALLLAAAFVRRQAEKTRA